MAIIPLFPAVPGSSELDVLFLIIVLSVFLPIGNWVYRDAKARGSERAWLWATVIFVLLLFSLIPGLLGLLVYYFVRGDKIQEEQAQERTTHSNSDGE